MEKLIVIPVIRDEAADMLVALAHEIWGEFLDQNFDADDLDRAAFSEFFRRENIRKNLKNGYYFIVQNVKKESIGYFGVSQSGKETLWLDVIAVSSKFRGKRYAKRMLKVVEFLSKRAGCSFFATKVQAINAYAVKFFKLCGFVDFKTGTDLIENQLVKQNYMLKIFSGSRERFLKIMEEMQYGDK